MIQRFVGHARRDGAVTDDRHHAPIVTRALRGHRHAERSTN